MKTILFAMLLTTTAGAQAAEYDRDKTLALWATCGGTNALVASQLSGDAARLVNVKARVFREALRTEAPKLADTLIIGAIHAISSGYDAGEYTWDEVVDLAEDCPNSAVWWE